MFRMKEWSACCHNASVLTLDETQTKVRDCDRIHYRNIPDKGIAGLNFCDVRRIQLLTVFLS